MTTKDGKGNDKDECTGEVVKVDIKGLFDALYNKFLLRDFFAKAVPGGLLLLFFFDGYNKPQELLKDLSIWLWLFLLGLSWIAGFVAQALGELTGIVRYYPSVLSKKTWRKVREDDSDLKDLWVLRGNRKIGDTHFAELLDDFDKTATDTQRGQRERFVVIKETCGNTAAVVAIIAAKTAGDLLVSGGWASIWQGVHDHIVFVLFGIVTWILLWYMHLKHVSRQFRHMLKVLRDIT